MALLEFSQAKYIMLEKIKLFYKKLRPERQLSFTIQPGTNRNTIYTIARFEFFEHIRNKWLITYALALLILANLVVYLGGNNPLQASGSLLSLVLLLVPIFSLIFGSISFTESLPFMELLAAQPVRRRDIFIGKWLGLCLGLSLAFIIGMGAGSLLSMDATGQGWLVWALLIFLGALLSFVFVAVAFLLANLSARKEIVFGLTLGVWFFFFILHDLIIFGIVATFGDYPLEWAIFLLSLINPIGLVRIIITLQMDISALMGATGAVMNKFLGGSGGILLGCAMLCFWTIIPLLLGIKIFNKRNL